MCQIAQPVRSQGWEEVSLLAAVCYRCLHICLIVSSPAELVSAAFFQAPPRPMTGSKEGGWGTTAQVGGVGIKCFGNHQPADGRQRGKREKEKNQLALWQVVTYLCLAHVESMGPAGVAWL